MVSIAGLMATSNTGVAKNNGWVGNGSTVTYRGTLSITATNQVTFTAGTLISGTAVAGSAGVLTFLPDLGLADQASNTAAGSKATASIKLF
jgi:hypothetical protein